MSAPMVLGGEAIPIITSVRVWVGYGHLGSQVPYRHLLGVCRGAYQGRGEVNCLFMDKSLYVSSFFSLCYASKASLYCFMAS